jgi:hypothetical protein
VLLSFLELDEDELSDVDEDEEDELTDDAVDVEDSFVSEPPVVVDVDGVAVFDPDRLSVL